MPLFPASYEDRSDFKTHSINFFLKQSIFIAGFYFYIEATGRTIGEVATLVSPYIQSNGNATCMVFYYHLYGQSIGTLRVKVGNQVLWQLSGNQGNDWYKATVPLNFNATYRVR